MVTSLDANYCFIFTGSNQYCLPHSCHGNKGPPYSFHDALMEMVEEMLRIRIILL